jgi:hypothetical protein
VQLPFFAVSAPLSFFLLLTQQNDNFLLPVRGSEFCFVCLLFTAQRLFSLLVLATAAAYNREAEQVINRRMITKLSLEQQQASTYITLCTEPFLREKN